MDPPTFAREMQGFDRPWWVVGGWAIEAATGYQREHEDTDVSILACDVPAFVEFIKGRWHVWNNVGGVLHPLGDRWPTVDDPASQLWLRAPTPPHHGSSTSLSPPTQTASGPTSSCRTTSTRSKTSPGWPTTASDTCCLKSFFAYKARLRRAKDEPDFEATLAESRGVVGFEVILGAYSALSIASRSSLSLRS
jgi:hypothetical protein